VKTTGCLPLRDACDRTVPLIQRNRRIHDSAGCRLLT
jgi:hypothetical protein